MIKIIKEINKRELKEFLYNIDLSDNNLYEELNEGRALSVFQFSGDTAENLVTRIKPKNFNEMCAVNALARPGTIDFADDYIDSKDKNVNKYPKLVQEVLKDSYGVCLFQESIMSIFNKIGGFTLEETNCLFKDTLITTSEGQKTIEEIVKNRLKIKILTFNEETNNLEWKNIKNYFNNGKKQMIKISLEDGTSLQCTKEHKLYTKNRGWVEAQDLTDNDELFHYKS